MDEQSNYDYGETEKCSRNFSQNYGEHPEETTGVFDSPVERIAGFRQKTPVLRALRIFSILVDLIIWRKKNWLLQLFNVRVWFLRFGMGGKKMSNFMSKSGLLCTGK